MGRRTLLVIFTNLNQYNNYIFKSPFFKKESRLGTLLQANTKKAFDYYRNKYNLSNRKIFSKDRALKHPPLQRFIFEKNPFTIAYELFVWKLLNSYNFSAKYITGHIDLLLVYDGVIYIADYKPNETNFLRVLPQVASYGLILKDHLELPVRCIIFNEKNSWDFDPTIILFELSNIIKKIRNPALNPIWEKIFKSSSKMSHFSSNISTPLIF